MELIDVYLAWCSFPLIFNLAKFTVLLPTYIVIPHYCRKLNDSKCFIIHITGVGTGRPTSSYTNDDQSESGFTL